MFPPECYPPAAFAILLVKPVRIYAKPSLEMLKAAMDQSNPELNAEDPLWPDDEDEFARICGLR